MASETRDEPPVSTTMPSARLAGATSTPRNCERNPTKPIATPMNTIASAVTTTARSHPRGAAGGAFVA